MDDTDAPTRISVQWANNAAPGYITVVPVASQIGIANGRASWTDGFVPLNFVPQAAGGVPPFGDDTNGALNQISAGLQWLQAGGPQPHDSAFSSAIGGYPANSVIISATGVGLAWISSVDGNTSDPDAGGANWAPAVLRSSSNRLNAGTSAVYSWAGNPNTHVAGTAASATTAPDVVWDTTNGFIWVCTTTGNAAAAVWKRPAIGQPITAPTIVTATGAYSVAVPTGAALCIAEGWAAGGGGGWSSDTTHCSSGASAGSYGSINLDVRAGGNVTGSVGAGGAGSGSSASGGAGGNTTVIYNAITYTAGGGPGGLSEQAGSANSPALPTTSGAWTRAIIGQQGNGGFTGSGGLVFSGNGGGSPLGGYGGVGGGGVPSPGVTPGGGGGGASNGAGTGGAGARGQVVLTFY